MRHRGELKRHELIGLEIEIVSSTHSGYVGMKGRVVDETKRMLVMEVDGMEKRVPKRLCVFEFIFDGYRERVDGAEIEFRPEDRIKRVR